MMSNVLQQCPHGVHEETIGVATNVIEPNQEILCFSIQINAQQHCNQPYRVQHCDLCDLCVGCVLYWYVVSTVDLLH